MEKKVQIGDKEYTVKEIKYKDFVNKAGSLPQEDKQTAAGKLIMLMSTNITDEEYDNLSMKDGITLQKAVNELNGLEDFQKPLNE